MRRITSNLVRVLIVSRLGAHQLSVPIVRLNEFLSDTLDNSASLNLPLDDRLKRYQSKVDRFGLPLTTVSGHRLSSIPGLKVTQNR